MSHLTQEQFEDILQGGQPIPEHVGQCPDCRARLEEKKALAQRVRGAFFAIQAGPNLTNRIQADITAAGQAAGAARTWPQIIPLQFRRHIRSTLAAAAAILITVAFVAFYIDTGSRIKAAQTELVGIHRANLNSLEQSANSGDAQGAGTQVESEVGYSPVMPCGQAEMNACRCTVRQFCGRPVASYVVKGPNAPVSVIVVPHSPKALGMMPARGEVAAKRTVWQAACGNCNMASVRIGERSYCAVGQVTQEELASVLNALSE
jgi:anti-sigma factor RsiW